MGAAFAIENFFNDNKAYLMDLIMETIEMDCQLIVFLLLITNHFFGSARQLLIYSINSV